MQPSTVLAALAELAPAGGDRILDVTRGGQPLAWLADADRAPRKADIDRLAALDALHREERILRRGWGWLAGRTEVGGAPRKVRAPLLSQPVRLDRTLGGYRVVPAGDLEISPLVEDRDLAARMEAAPGLGTPGWLTAIGTSSWLWTVGEATGLPLDALTGSHQRLPADRLVLVAQAALFVVRDVFGPALGESLRSWSGRDLSGTALSVLYADDADPQPPEGEVRYVDGADRQPPEGGVRYAGGAGPRPPEGGVRYAGGAGPRPPEGEVRYADGAGPRPPEGELRYAGGAGPRPPKSAGAERQPPEIGEPISSPLPLTEAQLRVVASARSAPLTVVSGPPGNGKSHAVIAAALDVVHRGGSVLVATQSPHAADVLAGLLARYPGPAPVLFGDAEKRSGLAASLAAGIGPGTADRDLRADRAATDQHLASVRAIERALTTAITTEQQAADLPRWQPRLAELAADVPGAFAPAPPKQQPRSTGTLQWNGGVDLEHAAALLARGRETGGGWWRRWRAAAAYRRGRALLGVRQGVPDQRVTDAIEAATAQRAAAHLAATGGTDLTPHWAALHEAEAALAASVGAAMNRAARSARRWTSAGRREAAALATALRSGRNRRRELLAALDGPPLVRALPLWIGTVTDVEDLLPPVPGLFDLVVIDEASHVDQIRAAPVLARARRALVAGDPRQLRFVSFVSDVDVAEVLSRHGVDDRADVRRVSTFDLAAGSAPAIWLDEHHRSAPHLIGFSAKRFYDDRIAVATRRPGTDNADVIDVVRAGGVKAEVGTVVDIVRELAGTGRTGIGVVSPFRAQADALEAALLAAFPADRIEALRLRVGTVHAFQGSEADVVVASLGLAPGATAGRRRFVADPHLFNVLITRARERFVLVTSVDTADGLLGDYLAYAGKPPPFEPGPDATGWAASLTTELHRLGATVRPNYAVGAWQLDLVVGEGVGVLCGVHPDGPDAHVRRQRAMHRAGWDLTDAFPSRWHGDPRRAALELIQAREPRRASSGAPE